jgi:hypothetical protein
MTYPRRGLPLAVVPAFLAVAILGYLLGRSHDESPPVERARVTLGIHVVIEPPPAWLPTRTAPGIPNLPMTEIQGIAPNGRANDAGMLVGTLPAADLAPLPGAFVASLERLPETKIVNLVEAQAYRYTGLRVPGLGRALTLFVIPVPGGDATGLACYAPSGTSPLLRACESAVASVTVQDQSRAYELTPEVGYAERISDSISTLDKLRVALKRRLRGEATASQAQQLATSLAGGYAAISTTLSELEPTSSAQRVQAVLAAAAAAARAGYTALAAAAGERNVSAYVAAQKQIADAEAAVNRALESFALLGYSSASEVSAGAKS